MPNQANWHKFHQRIQYGIHLSTTGLSINHLPIMLLALMGMLILDRTLLLMATEFTTLSWNLKQMFNFQEELKAYMSKDQMFQEILKLKIRIMTLQMFRYNLLTINILQNI